MPPRAQDPTAPAPDVKDASASSPATGEEVSDEQSPAQAFHDLRTRLGELSEYLSYYISAKTDSIKVSIRNIGIYAGLGILGLFAGGAFVVTAVVLLCPGV